MSGAQAIVECLIEQGVDTVFGYPGGTILPLYDALHDAPLRHILTVHEQGAAHAADGYARAGGRVGVCIATSGPGATNLVTGLAAAYMDSSPVVAITGQVPTSLIGRDAFQEVDIAGITLPITKHNFQVKSSRDLPDTLRKAFQIAKTGRPGPVLVDVPRDIQTAEIDFTPETVTNPVVPRFDPGLLAEAAAAISSAKRPVIIAGGGAIAAEAAGQLKILAETGQIPVVSTLMGLGAFPASHQLFFGLTGMHGHKVANYAVRHADVIIAAGSRFSDRVTGDRAAYAAGKTVIHIDVDPAEIDKNVAAQIGLAGDMKQIISQLNSRVKNVRTGDWHQTLAACRQAAEQSVRTDGLAAADVMNHIAEKASGKPYIFATDVGQHQMWAAQGLKIESPRSWLTSGGLGAMGFGLPAAIGAQLAEPGKRVVHIAGDGGFKMTGTELYTAAVYKLPIISIIINNCGLGMIRQLQHAYFEQRYTSCQLPPADFVSFAKAFGIEAGVANSLEDFAKEFSTAMAVCSPRVIVVNISGQDMVTPMLAAGATLDEYIEL